MNTKIILTIILIATLSAFGQNTDNLHTPKEVQNADAKKKVLQTVPQEQDKPIEEYVEFIREHNQNPVDYILGLFEHADIVVLCERSHNEITQYELITNTIKDKRFIENVGHVFLETMRRFISILQICRSHGKE